MGTLSAVNAGLAIGLLVKLGLYLSDRVYAETTDLAAFRAGWWLALHDPRHLYDAAAQAGVERRFMKAIGSPGFVNGLLAFLHPPHLALAGVWIAWLGDHAGGRVVTFVWLTCNLGLLAVLVAQIRRQLNLDREGTVATAASVLAFYPLFDTLSQGQFSLLLAVAALGLGAALDARRPWRAAAWLLVLSFKPQLFPAVAAVLVGRRDWRALGAAAAVGLAALGVTAVVLGVHVWGDWALAVRGLERTYGGGSAAVMPTLRGLLARTFPALIGRPLETIGLCLWIAGAVAVLVVLWRDGRSGRQGDGRRAVGFGLAVALVTSPHLYSHDLLLWVVPTALVLAVARGHDGWSGGVRLALAWPAWAMLAVLVDQSDAWPPRLPVDPRLIPVAIALVAAFRHRRRSVLGAGT